MMDLIGKQYGYGQNGIDTNEIDCINLVRIVHRRLGKQFPEIKPEWYTLSKYGVMRELLKWTIRVEQPSYDGDIALIYREAAAFAVVWQNGALYINKMTQQVAWSPLEPLGKFHCFRMKKI